MSPSSNPLCSQDLSPTSPAQRYKKTSRSPRAGFNNWPSTSSKETPMVEKRLLCPNRRRRTPAQFSWLDHRLMRERRLESCPVEAWALYLFPRHRGRRAGAELLLRRFPHRACAPRAPRASTRPLSPHRRRTHRLRAPAVSGPLARRRAPHPRAAAHPPEDSTRQSAKQHQAARLPYALRGTVWTRTRGKQKREPTIVTGRHEFVARGHRTSHRDKHKDGKEVGRTHSVRSGPRVPSTS